MRPARITAAFVVAAAVAITGCTAHPTAHHPATPAAPVAAAPPAPRTPTAATTTTGTPAPGGATTPATATTPQWPTSPRSASAGPVTSAGKPYLLAIRLGHHPGYDRLVFEFAGAVPGSKVRYVPEVREDASDRPVPLHGRAFLSVVFHDASMFSMWDPPPVHRTYAGACTLTPRLPSVQQVKCAGDFEGYLSFGVGVGRYAGFRVSTLQHPARVVIDVAT